MAKKIKLFLADVDSTLTDGIYHVSEHGRISKNFFTRDFWGLWKLHESGVKIVIITAGNDNVIDHQCRRAGKYIDVIKGTRDKRESVSNKYGPRFSWDEIAYIGDDVFDIGLLSAVGLCACPSDAVGEVLEVVQDRARIELDETEGFHSNFDGGKGCVREFAEYVLAINEAQNHE